MQRKLCRNGPLLTTWIQQALYRLHPYRFRSAPGVLYSRVATLEGMLDELSFRRNADRAIESLKQSLIDAEEDGGFEVEEQNGLLNIVFEEPPAKFVITPNAPVRQIWISALSTSFKLDWSEAANDFVFPKDSLSLKPLVARLINE